MADDTNLEAEAAKAILLTEHGIQRYLAHVLGIDEKKMWPDGITPASAIDMKHGGKIYSLRLELVPKQWMFKPIVDCKEAMAILINYATIIYARVLNGVTPGLDTERLRNSKLVTDPQSTTMVIYAPLDAKKVRDMPMRLGFVLSTREEILQNPPPPP